MLKKSPFPPNAKNINKEIEYKKENSFKTQDGGNGEKKTAKYNGWNKTTFQRLGGKDIPKGFLGKQCFLSAS